MSRRPTIIITATNARTLAIVSATVAMTWDEPRPKAALRCMLPSSSGTSAGIRTSAKTIAMSSTISQPIAMWPRSVVSSRRSCKARSSTTVLATESASPNTGTCADRPPHQGRQAHAEQGCDGHLDERAGNGDGADRPEILQ